MSRWRDLSKVLAEAKALGAEFRIWGGKVVQTGADLPAETQVCLDAFQDLLPAYLDVAADDRASSEFFDKLGVSIVLVEVADDCPAIAKALYAEAKALGLPIACDTETAPLEPQPRPPVALRRDGGLSARQPKANDAAALSVHRGRIALLQLYAGGSEVYLFRGAALEAMLRSTWLRRAPLVFHNAKFDSLWLRHEAERRNAAFLFPREPPGRHECSLQAAGLVVGTGHAGETRRLEHVAETLLGLSPPKQLATSDWSAPELTKGQQAYAATDVVLTHRIWGILHQELHRLHRWHAYELQRGCGDAIGEAEKRGVAIDCVEFHRQLDQWTADLCEARAAYKEQTGSDAPNTPNEIRQWLQGILPPDQLATWPRTKNSGELSFAEEALGFLHTMWAARAVLRMLSTQKLIRSFGQKFICKISPVTGRFHASFTIAAARTGRFTCKEPNLQQLPSHRTPEFRKVIVASAGNLLVGGDYSQVEVRAAAWISRDEALTEVYRSGGDIHRETAATINRCALADVTEAQRQAAKAIVFGSLFGMGPRKLAAYAHQSFGVEMTEGEAAHSLDSFFARFRSLWRWRRDNARTCEARGYIEVPTSGRVVDRAWSTRKPQTLLFTECCNYPIQGACADLLMLAIRIVHERLGEAGIGGEHGGLICCVHDELLLEVREGLAERAKALQGNGNDDFWSQ